MQVILKKHISNRLSFYDLGNTNDFENDGRSTMIFLTRSLMGLAPAILEEATRLNIPMPQVGFEHEDFPGITTSEMLDFDIDDVDKDQQKENIVKIANEFLSIADNFDQLGFFEPLERWKK